MSILTFTPVHPMPAAQELMTILISPAFDAGSASGHDLTCTPSLGYDAQGRLYAGYPGYFETPYEDGLYIGPRPVIEVVRVASRQMVVIVTDHDVFVMGESEYAAQVVPAVRMEPCDGADSLLGTSFWTGEGDAAIEVFVPTEIRGPNVPAVCLPVIEMISLDDAERIAAALSAVKADPRFHAALDAAQVAA